MAAITGHELTTELVERPPYWNKAGDRTTESFRAKCSCGWVGKLKGTRPKAAVDGDRHLHQLRVQRVAAKKNEKAAEPSTNRVSAFG